MKRTILLVLICLFSLSIFSVSGQEYNEHDLQKLKSFMKQVDEEGKSNIQKLIGFNQLLNWEDDDENKWIGELPPSFISWTSDQNEKRITEIKYPSGGQSGYMFGVCDFSDCVKLTRIDLAYNSLTKINLNGCVNLDYLKVSDNKITYIDLRGCDALEKSYLSITNNNLWFSKMLLPLGGAWSEDESWASLGTHEVEYSFFGNETNEYVFDLGNEGHIDYIDWNSWDYYSDDYPNEYSEYFDYDVEIVDSERNIIKIKLGNGATINKVKCQIITRDIDRRTINCEFIEDYDYRLEVNIGGLVENLQEMDEPWVNRLNIQIYKKDGEPVDVEWNDFTSNTLIYFLEEPDSYILKFNMNGYMSTYYNEAGGIVSSWKYASKIELSPKNNTATVGIYLYPEKIFEETDNITISGTIWEDNGIDKVPALKAQIPRNSTVSVSSKPSAASSNYTLISTQYTKNGEYIFTGLPKAHYLITVEIAGYEQGSIEIDANDPEADYSENDFTVDSETKIITPASTSVIDILSETKISVFHNMKTNVVSIKEVEENYSVRIINIRGQVVKSIKNNVSELDLDINNIPAGVYFVSIESKGRIENYKIVK